MAVSVRGWTIGRWVALALATVSATLLVIELVPLWLGWTVLVVSGVAAAWLWGAGRLLAERAFQWAGTLGFVAIVLVLVNVLGARHSLRLDLTRGKRHTLSQETVQLLQQLGDPVKVVAFPQGGSSKQLEDLLKEYRHESRQVSYRLVDPDRQPTIARDYSVTSYGAVVVEAMGGREQLFDVTESTLTNAIARLLAQEQSTVTFVLGHGEHDPDDTERSGAALARDVLESRNFKVTSTVMALDDSALGASDVIIVGGPKTEPLDQEVEALRNHLRNGGGVLLLVDPPPSASWNAFSESYSLRREDSFLLDENPLGSLFGADQSVPLVSEYGTHPITEGFNLATFFPLASPIVSLSDTSRAVALAMGSELTSAVGPDSVAQPAEEGVELVLAWALETTPPDSTRKSGRLVLAGDSDFMTNVFIGLSGNRDFFLNCVQWLATQEERISIRPRPSEGEPLILTGGAASSIFLVAVILLPGAAAVGALVVWWRRR
jgi:ABC-type uncharacterized transport system involved in gliding motility auxiliary subunit